MCVILRGHRVGRGRGPGGIPLHTGHYLQTLVFDDFNDCDWEHVVFFFFFQASVSACLYVCVCARAPVSF